MMCSPILPIVTDAGIVEIGGADSWPSTRTGSSSLISHFGILQDRIAEVDAYEHASNKFPSWSITLLSEKMPMTDLSLIKTNLDKSIIELSLIPRSTTLASSITPSCGGPVSAVGCAKGRISAVQMKIPFSPISGKGLSGWIFTPAITSVSPNLTRAEPFAFGMTPVSIVSFLGSSNALPSILLPLSNNSIICFLFSPSRIETLAITMLHRFQNTCLELPVFGFRILFCIPLGLFQHIFCILLVSKLHLTELM